MVSMTSILYLRLLVKSKINYLCFFFFLPVDQLHTGSANKTIKNIYLQMPSTWLLDKMASLTCFSDGETKDLNSYWTSPVDSLKKKKKPENKNGDFFLIKIYSSIEYCGY